MTRPTCSGSHSDGEEPATNQFSMPCPKSLEIRAQESPSSISDEPSAKANGRPLRQKFVVNGSCSDSKQRAARWLPLRQLQQRRIKLLSTERFDSAMVGKRKRRQSVICPSMPTTDRESDLLGC